MSRRGDYGSPRFGDLKFSLAITSANNQGNATIKQCIVRNIAEVQYLYDERKDQVLFLDRLICSKRMWHVSMSAFIARARPRKAANRRIGG